MCAAASEASRLHCLARVSLACQSTFAESSNIANGARKSGLRLSFSLLVPGQAMIEASQSSSSMRFAGATICTIQAVRVDSILLRLVLCALLVAWRGLSSSVAGRIVSAPVH